jgi:hypothetical protein
MSQTGKKGLIIGLIACLALAVIIPNILILVFGGKDAVLTVNYILILIGIFGVLLVICLCIGFLFQLPVALMHVLIRGPVAPTTLMRLMWEVLVRDVFKKKRGTPKNSPPSNTHHSRGKDGLYSNSKPR